jgi:membrane protein
VIGFARFVALRFHRDRCLQIAGSLTYTTLLSLVPLFTIAVTLLAAFPVFDGFIVQVKVFLLLNLVPEVAGKIITVYMEEFADNAARLSVFGIVFLLVTAIAMMMTIDRAFNSIWRVVRQRPLLISLLVYWALITLGPLLIGMSVSFKVYVESFTRGAVESYALGQFLLWRAMPVALTTGALYFFYRVVPNRFVPRSHALIGAAAAAVALEGMKHGLTLYVRAVPTYDLVYGAFASIPILLLWLFLGWSVLLAGAEITASLSHWRGALWRRADAPEARFHDALRLLQLLHRARAAGRPVGITEMRERLPIPLASLEDALDKLLEGTVIDKTAQGQYLLLANPDAVRVADIYRLFVLQGEALVDAAYTDLSPHLATLVSERDAGMRLSLDEAFREEGLRAPSHTPALQPLAPEPEAANQ